jgi:hypothetical protein
MWLPLKALQESDILDMLNNPLVLLVCYKNLCRPIQRFWFLETVARMPYFSYISCIHLYETLGDFSA